MFAQLLLLVGAVATDTPEVRPRAVELSPAYERRLTLHRWLGYTVPPLFAFQYAAGSRIWKDGIGGAPAWARDGHRIGAFAIGTVFVANTATGLMNLWDSRAVEEGRARRTVHAISMLVADAGFTWAGAFLSEQAERDIEKRRLHRTVALSSMGIALVSGIGMAILNR